MIPAKVKSLIDKYCMGVRPSDSQMDEIMDMCSILDVNFAEVSEYIQQMMAGPTKEEREAEAKRKAEEDARRKAKEDAERMAKAEAEEKAKAEKIKREAEVAKLEKERQIEYEKSHRKSADGSMHEIEHINATTIWDKQTGLEYYEYQGMPLALCGDRKKSSKLVVLESVQEIPARMFANDSHIEQLVLPQSIKKIGKEAFKNCVNLMKVDLNWGLESMEDECFADCCRLSDVKFSQTVLTYGKNLFSGCPLLKKESFVVSSKVQSIGSHALDAFGMIFVKDQTMAKLVRKSQSLFCSSEIIANSILYM